MALASVGGLIPPNSLFQLFALKQTKSSASASVLTTHSVLDESQAMSILNEFSKALHSQDRGAQAEAIEFFPRLLEQHRQAVVANAALLKLVDVFVNTDNALRLRVLFAFRASTAAIRRSASHAEMVRRLAFVRHSNDPVSRALTILAMSTFVSALQSTSDGTEKTAMHHSVDDLLFSRASTISGERTAASDDRSSKMGSDGSSITFHTVQMAILSSNPIEMMAALHATVMLCQWSAEFSAGAVAVLQQLCNNISSPLDAVLVAISAMATMSHEYAIAVKAREWMMKQINLREEARFRYQLVRALTLLTTRRPEFVAEHITFCLHLVSTDPRGSISSLCLKALALLCRQHPQAWTPPLLHALFVVLEQMFTNHFHSQVALVLGALKFVWHHHRISALEDEDAWAAVAVSFCQLVFIDVGVDDVCVAAIESAAFSLLWWKHDTLASTHRVDLADRIYFALAAQLLRESSRHSGNPSHSSSRLQRLLNTLWSLSLLIHNCVQAEIVQLLRQCVVVGDSDCGARIVSLLIRFSARFPNWANRSVLLSTAPTNLTAVHTVECTVAVCTSLFLSRQSLTMDEHSQISKQVQSLARSLIDAGALGSLYAVGRSALVRGFPRVAEYCFGVCLESTTSESSYFWISALQMVADAEAQLSANPILETANTVAGVKKLNAATVSLSAAVTPVLPMLFPFVFIRLRLQLVELMSNFSQSLKKHDYSGLVKLQTRFEILANELKSLEWSYFDMDGFSLLSLATLQKLPILFCQLLSFFQTGAWNGENVTPGVTGQAALLQLTQALSVINTTLSSLTILPTHHEAWRAACINRALSLIYSCPLPYPRYFFRAGPTSTMQLITTPPHSGADAIPVDISTQFLVKVEGLLNFPTTVRGRAISQVVVTFQYSAPDEPEVGQPAIIVNALLKDDTFQCSCAIPLTSRHRESPRQDIRIIVRVLDNHRKLWQLFGSEVVIRVKML